MSYGCVHCTSAIHTHIWPFFSSMPCTDICDISVKDAHYPCALHIPVPKHFIILSFLLMLPLSRLYPQTIRKEFAQLVQFQPT